MMASLLQRSLFLTSRFKLAEFARDDLVTMCALLREKYLRNNEEIQTSGLIKLLDDRGRVLGIYSASEARKKAVNMGLDMVLVSSKVTPPICKVSNFRDGVISRFYQEIVLKKHQELLKKAAAIKGLRISPNLNSKEMALKLKQVIELSQKNKQVRITMPIRAGMREEGLGKLEWIKSELINTCYLEKQIAASRGEEEEDEEVDQRKRDRKLEYYSFVVSARESNLAKRSQKEKNLTPNDAVKSFLNQYYAQNDSDMMDLKSTGNFATVEQEEQPTVPETTQQPQEQEREENEELVYRQAKARLLNKRLKTLLSLYQ